MPTPAPAVRIEIGSRHPGSAKAPSVTTVTASVAVDGTWRRVEEALLLEDDDAAITAAGVIDDVAVRVLIDSVYPGACIGVDDRGQVVVTTAERLAAAGGTVVIDRPGLLALPEAENPDQEWEETAAAALTARLRTTPTA